MQRGLEIKQDMASVPKKPKWGKQLTTVEFDRDRQSGHHCRLRRSNQWTNQYDLLCVQNVYKNNTQYRHREPWCTRKNIGFRVSWCEFLSWRFGIYDSVSSGSLKLMSLLSHTGGLPKRIVRTQWNGKLECFKEILATIHRLGPRVSPTATQPTRLLWSISTDQETVPSTVSPTSPRLCSMKHKHQARARAQQRKLRSEQQGCWGRAVPQKEGCNWLAPGNRWRVFRGRAPARLESPGEGHRIYMMTWHPRKKRGSLALG